jgi:outer membrane protein assembly factor BamE (lipoprotein component of BamABCDE complex)
MDFDTHSAVESYLESLPEPTREAIKSNKAIVGMDREQVLLALGTPVSKSRETKDDVDYEDWIFGKPPGIIRFVTFAGAKVEKIKEFYVGLNGNTAQTGPIK